MSWARRYLSAPWSAQIIGLIAVLVFRGSETPSYSEGLQLAGRVIACVLVQVAVLVSSQATRWQVVQEANKVIRIEREKKWRDFRGGSS